MQMKAEPHVGHDVMS